MESKPRTSVLPDMPQPASITDRRIRHVLEQIDAEPQHSVPSLARAHSLSASHLEHLFKRHTGRRLREHIIHARVCRAEHLLKTTELSIKEIALCVGYAHSPSFIRVFTSIRDESPRAYRHRA